MGRGASAWWGALSFLISPINTNGTGTKPFSVHGRDSLLRVRFVAEGEETVTTRLARVHVPHNASIGHGTKSAEGLGEDIVIDFGAEISNENMVVTGGILLILLALICPINSNFSIKYFATIEGLKGGFRSTHVDIFHKAIVETSVLVVPVWNDFDMLNGSSDSENLGQHVLCDTGTQVPDIQMSPSLGDKEIRM